MRNSLQKQTVNFVKLWTDFLNLMDLIPRLLALSSHKLNQRLLAEGGKEAVGPGGAEDAESIWYKQRRFDRKGSERWFTPGGKAAKQDRSPRTIEGLSTLQAPEQVTTEV